MEISLKNIKSVVTNNDFELPLTPVIGTKNVFRLTQNIKIELSDGEIFLLKRGWEYDGASVPWIFQPLFPKWGEHSYSSLVHDMLYFTHYKSRKFADKEHYLWGKTIGVKPLDNNIRYAFLRMFAWYAWLKGKYFPSKRLKRNILLTIKLK